MSRKAGRRLSGFPTSRGVPLVIGSILSRRRPMRPKGHKRT